MKIALCSLVTVKHECGSWWPRSAHACPPVHSFVMVSCCPQRGLYSLYLSHACKPLARLTCEPLHAKMTKSRRLSESIEALKYQQ